jgi:ankyrin repeat protein
VKSLETHFRIWRKILTKADKDVAEVLLANGADGNAKENKGWTPLYDAAIACYKNMVELL